MIQPLFIFSDWGLFILRAVFGLIFLLHSLPQIRKIKERVKAKNFGSIAISILEFLGSVALILGFLTQFLAFIFAVILLIMILRWKLYQSYPLQGWFAILAFDWLLIAVGLALAALGGGYYSVDSYLSFFLY